MGFVFFECKNNGKTRDFLNLNSMRVLTGLYMWTSLFGYGPCPKRNWLMWLMSKLKKMLLFLVA